MKMDLLEKIPVRENTSCVIAQELSDGNTGLTLWKREGRRLATKSLTLRCSSKKISARSTESP